MKKIHLLQALVGLAFFSPLTINAQSIDYGEYLRSYYPAHYSEGDLIEANFNLQYSDFGATPHGYIFAFYRDETGDNSTMNLTGCLPLSDTGEDSISLSTTTLPIGSYWYIGVRMSLNSTCGSYAAEYVSEFAFSDYWPNDYWIIYPATATSSSSSTISTDPVVAILLSAFLVIYTAEYVRRVFFS